MSYPRYHNVQRVEGGAMSFEAYLKQIRLLYPNLADLYTHYLQTISHFTAEQLGRMLQLQRYDLAGGIFDDVLAALQQTKLQDEMTFLAFDNMFDYKNIVAQLFDIVSLSFEEWLDIIHAYYDEGKMDEYTYYIQQVDTYKTMQTNRMAQLPTNPVRDNILAMVAPSSLVDFDTAYTALNTPDYHDYILSLLMEVLNSSLSKGLDYQQGYADSFTLLEQSPEWGGLKEMAKVLFNLVEKDEASGDLLVMGHIESDTLPYTDRVEFLFTQPYKTVVSVSLSSDQNADLYYELIQDTDGLYSGVVVLCDNPVPDMVVSMQAICEVE